MSSEEKNSLVTLFLNNKKAVSLVRFFVKAIILLALVWFIGFLTPFAPMWMIVLPWLVLSALTAPALAYPFLIRKINDRTMFVEGSISSWYLNGRTMRLFFSFIASAILLFGLILGSQNWGEVEFGVIGVSLPIYVLVAYLVHNKFSKKELRKPYQKRITLVLSFGITTAILTILYFALLLSSQTGSYPTIEDALVATTLPFAQSPSPFLTEVGKAKYLYDGTVLYAVFQSKSASSFLWYLFLFLQSIWFSAGVVHILNFGHFHKRDYLRAFLPLTEEVQHFNVKKQFSYCAFGSLVILVVIGMGICQYGEVEASKIAQTKAYSSVENTARSLTKITGYKVEDRMFTTTTVERARDSASANNESVQAAKENAIREVNEAYDGCLEKIDKYLDWYYDLPTKIVHFFQRFVDADEEDIRNQYQKVIGEPLQAKKALKALKTYNELQLSQAQEVKELLLNSDADELPDWIVYEERQIDEFFEYNEAPTKLLLQNPDSRPGDRNQYQERIVNAIEQSRLEVLESIEG